MKKNIKKRIMKAKQFIVNDVWDIEPSSMSALRRLGVRTARVIHLVFRGFKEDECPLHASALTFNTLMAVVPILALSLALARVFGGAEAAEKRLRGLVEQHVTSKLEVADTTNGVPETVTTTNGMATATNSVSVARPPVAPTVTNAVSGARATPGSDITLHGSKEDVLSPQDLALQLNDMLDAGFRQVEKINFAALGSLGFILLIWMVVAVLGRAEASFNRVWGVSQGRPMFRKFTDYMFMVIVLPFLITMATSIKIAEIVTKFMSAERAISTQAFLDSAPLRGLTVLIMTTLTLTFLLKFMPSTRVRFRPALAGGLVAAILFIFWLWICSAIQVGVVKYSKFYGSFAIVPIVLAWVYVSWEIVLFGAEVAFAVQNCTTYQMEQGAHRANIQSRVILALSVVMEAAKAMVPGEDTAFQPSEYAASHRVPVRFLNDIVDELSTARIMAQLSDMDDGYVLLRSPGILRVRDVIDTILHAGVGPESLGLAKVDPRIEQVVKAATSSIGGSIRESTIEELLAE